MPSHKPQIFTSYWTGLESEGVTPKGGGVTLAVQWPILRRRKRRKWEFWNFFGIVGLSHPFLVPQELKILTNFGILVKNRPILCTLKIVLHNYAWNNEKRRKNNSIKAIFRSLFSDLFFKIPLSRWPNPRSLPLNPSPDIECSSMNYCRKEIQIMKGIRGKK